MRKWVRINVNSNLYKLGKKAILMLVRIPPATCSFFFCLTSNIFFGTQNYFHLHVSFVAFFFFLVPIIADPKLPFSEEFSEVSKVEIIQTDYVWNSFDFVSGDLRFPWWCWKEVFEQIGVLWKRKIAEWKIITFEFKTLSHPVALYTWENAVFSFGKPTF